MEINGGRLTVAPGLLVGSDERYGRLRSGVDGGALTNRGIIRVDTGLRSDTGRPSSAVPLLTLELDEFLNDVGGRVEVASGDRLDVVGNWANAGTVAVESGGVLHVEGNLQLSSSSQMMAELSSVSAHGGDGLATVQGEVSLAGALSLGLASDFVPTLGDRRDLITADTMSGTFDSVDGVLPVGGAGGLGLAVLYDEAEVDVLATLPGDSDGDLDVDFADFLSLRAGFGKEGSWAQGDFDGTGQVGFADFLLLRSNFGRGGAGSGAGYGEMMAFGSTIPEPSAATALLFAGALCLRRRQ